MALNITNVQLSNAIDISFVFGLFLFSVSISILLSCLIIILIFTTKTLFTPPNVLICNTCVTTFFYLIMAIMKISVFYHEVVLSDVWCEILAYLSYVGLNLLVYSYVIQAISRLFFTILYRHRYLLKYKCHIILIICQIIISFLIPLPSIMTNDARFRPLKLCVIAMQYLFYVFYLHTFLFFIPFLTVVIIYIIILRRAIQSSLNTRQPWHRSRRDAHLVRNILIIFIIFIFSELPSVICLILSIRLVPTSKAFYMFAAAAPPISTTFEKLSVIILNKDIRKEIINRWRRLRRTLQLNSNRIQPLT